MDSSVNARTETLSPPFGSFHKDEEIQQDSVGANTNLNFGASTSDAVCVSTSAVNARTETLSPPFGSFHKDEERQQDSVGANTNLNFGASTSDAVCASTSAGHSESSSITIPAVQNLHDIEGLKKLNEILNKLSDEVNLLNVGFNTEHKHHTSEFQEIKKLKSEIERLHMQMEYILRKCAPSPSFREALKMEIQHLELERQKFPMEIALKTSNSTLNEVALGTSNNEVSTQTDIVAVRITDITEFAKNLARVCSEEKL